MIELAINNLEESLKNAQSLMKERKRRLMEIIEPFLDDAAERKKQVELADIAKLVFLTDLKLESVGESPDFVVLEAGKKIGVEVRQLYNGRVEYIKYIQRLFDIAAQKFRSQFPDAAILVNFWIEDGFSYRGRERSELAERIVEFVRSGLDGTDGKDWSFIERVDIQPASSNTTFQYNKGAYFQEELKPQIVLAAIQEKDAKIKEYVKNSGTPYQWLLLVNRETGSDSYDTEDFPEMGEKVSSFERIYLLKDFEFELLALK
jgi:hypothetical protein